MICVICIDPIELRLIFSLKKLPVAGTPMLGSTGNGLFRTAWARRILFSERGSESAPHRVNEQCRFRGMPSFSICAAYALGIEGVISCGLG